MFTVGGESTVIVTEIESEAELPNESVTSAVMEWLPIERVEIENDPAAPIAPSRSEFQFSEASRLPSSASFAVPVNVTDEPVRKLEPSAGAEMVRPLWR